MKKWKCECDECKFAPCTMETNNDIRPACCVAMTGRFSEWQEVKEEEETVTVCNQLPKLTEEVFDRPDCPEWANYAAVNKNGLCFFYHNKPDYGVCNYAGKWYVDDCKYAALTGEKFDPSDWQNSLIERPIKLPDWVEVGGYVYDKRNGYGKIVSGSVKSCYIEFHGGAGDFVPEAFSELQQARLRPYNADEMKALVGKIVTSVNGDVCMITDYDAGLREVCIYGDWFSDTELLNSVWQINNATCGVLEHLENGEWVE